MLAEDYFKNRVFYIEEPAWSEWTRTAMNLLYKLEVEDPVKVVKFLEKRGFKFENDWQESIVDFIANDLANMEKQNWFFEDNGFTVVPYSLKDINY